MTALFPKAIDTTVETSFLALHIIYISSLRSRLDTGILSTRNVVQCPLEMSSGVVETGAVFVGVEVRVDELNQSIEVFRRYLS